LPRAEATAEVLDTVRRDPHLLGQTTTRWTLATIGACCPWLVDRDPATIWQVLDALGIHWKRGKQHVHSPDPDYQAKKAYLAQIQQHVQAHPDRHVLLSLDEVTLFQQPSVAQTWEQQGRHDPLAERSHQKDRCWRVVATLDAASGQVVAWGRTHLSVATLVQFYADLRATYPQAERLYVVQDNWPVHFHPDLRAALEPQDAPWPFYQPANWPTMPHPAALRKWGDWQLPIQLVALPTYASWLNPIEKLWRWLRQTVLHHLRLAQEWSRVKAAVMEFLSQFAGPSPSLLHYVGLAPD
jgi:transposase